MAKRKTYHVVKGSEGKWTVKSSSSKRSIGRFETQKDAISKAKDVAKNKNGVLYIHRNDGLIRESRSYGSAPYPPKDRRPVGDAKGKVKISEDFDEEYVSND